jgi:glycosyltransferase involved in cell wall biosynthesis
LQALRLSCQPIFIDNASTDNSLALLKRYPDAMVIEHTFNEGYGSSIIDGFAAGVNENIVIIDADCEYPPECIPHLLAAIENNQVVYASRFRDRNTTRQTNTGWLKMKGNQCISHLYSRLFSQDVTDLYTGCKAIKRSCLNQIKLEQKGFEHVLELSVKLAAKQIPIHEIPVDFFPRQAGQSKMNHVTETAKYFYWLLRYERQYRAGKL